MNRLETSFTVGDRIRLTANSRWSTGYIEGVITSFTASNVEPGGNLTLTLTIIQAQVLQVTG